MKIHFNKFYHSSEAKDFTSVKCLETGEAVYWAQSLYIKIWFNKIDISIYKTSCHFVISVYNNHKKVITHIKPLELPL